MQQQVEEAKLRVDQTRREQSIGNTKNNQSSNPLENRVSSNKSPNPLFPPPAAIGYSLSGEHTMDASTQGGAMTNTPSGGLFPIIPDGR